jgi:hypothetical protein
MNYNTVYYRTAPRVNVLRGFWGNENLYITSSFPVDASITASQGIFSGQLMYVSPTGTWLLATATAAKGKAVYIAMEDSTDSDVVSVGKLLGLSCSNTVDVQTPYFDITQVYTRDTALTISATSGLLTPATATAGDSWIQNPSVDIVGYVTAGVVDLNIGGPGNMTGSLTGLVANTGIDSQSLPIGAGGSYVYGTQTAAANNALVGKIPVLQYVSRWIPARDVTNTVA